MANAVVGALRIDLAMNAGQFTRDSKKVQEEMSTLGRAITDISAKIDRSSIFFNSGLMAAQRFVGASQGILNVASTFEKGMSNVSTLIDTNVESMRDMSNAVLAIGQRTPVALTDLTQGLFDLRSAGIGAEDQMKLLEGSARLGVAALGTTAETVDIVTSAINAFGLKGEEADRIFDLLFKTTNYGKVTISQLAQGFGSVAGTVATAGVKIDEYLASVSALTTTGLPAAEAHTKLRDAITSLTRETDISKKVFETLGVKTFAELIKKSGGMVNAFGMIRETLQGNSVNILKLMGSVQGFSALMDLTGGNAQTFRKTLDEMRFGVEQVGPAFDKQNDTIFAATQRLTNNIQVLGIAMGNALAPTIKSVADFVADITSAFKSLSPEMQNLVARMGAFAAVTGPAVIAAGFFANALGSLIPIIASVGGLIAGLIASTGPIGMFIIASSAAVTAWNIFRDDIITIFNSVTSYIGEKIDQIIGKLGQLKGTLEGFASMRMGFLDEATWQGVTDTATPAVQGLADAFADLELQTNMVSVAVAVEREATLASVPITDLATEATNKRSEAQRILNQLMREGKQVIQEMATPEEAHLARQQKLSTLLMANAISAETYGRATEKATFVAANSYARMASGIADNLSKAFGENKAFAIAAAIVNTAESITKTLATYGATPWGIAAAAAAAAAGAAQIAAIRKTTKSGGGGGGGGGGAPVQSAGMGAIPQAMTVNIHGQTFGREQVFGLIDQINQAGRDGKHVIVRAA